MIRVQNYRPQPISVHRVGPGQQRKIGIIGSHGATLLGCPWADPSWEFWAHSSCANIVPHGRISLFIDVHPRHCFEKDRKNGFADYYGWLKHQPTPILMQRYFKEIPQSIAYPIDEIKAEWPQLQLGSQLAYLVAYALSRGVTQLGVWGCEYSHDSEYRFQRGNAQMWLGIAMGRGVQVTVSRHSTLLREFEDYAYETHATPEAVQRWIDRCGWKTNKFNTDHDEMTPNKLKAVDTPAAAAEAAAIRAKNQKFAEVLARLEAERPADAPNPYEWASEPALSEVKP